MATNTLKLKALPGEEIWEITVPGTVHLRVTKKDRHGNLAEGEMSIGPNRQGTQFKITTADREDNQQRVYEDYLDPFRNGLLVRVDADQQDEETTASEHALSTDALEAILSTHGQPFQNTVKKLSELNARRLLGLAEALDASAKQVEFLREYISESFTNGSPQPTIANEDNLMYLGESLSGETRVVSD